ncbi:DUF4258 domain-containing protein [Methylobacterium indicum]|uniref:DUF4258 domain-containing protein n=1 Tax=Methylobacterium indicum TaxID=1775910 RepID=A0ABR5HE05_9HYPH|nr:DUF4258 domain-containing protein [Methylobacterium indicum]KMO12026.1 hypothetical protein QR78_27865 [Methylobacterium indicum]KMO24689.1 hypothetical protein QR79_11040 [Methylobacterium indicum]
MRFTYTRHSRTVMEERGLDTGWVERTILHPDQLEQDARDPTLLRAFTAIPERDGRVLCVVYRPEPDGCIIVTAFLDRRRRTT